MVTKDFGDPPIGGIGVHVSELVSSLRSLGVEVQVATSRPSARGCRCRMEDLVPGIGGLALPLGGMVEELQANVALAACRCWDGQARPDVIHAHDFRVAWAGVAVAASLDVPLVVTKHSMHPLLMDRALTREQVVTRQYVAQCLKWLLDRSAGIIVISDAVRRSVEALSSAVGSRPPISVVRNGTSLAGYRPRRPALTGGGETRVLYAGRLAYSKGADVFAEVVSSLVAGGCVVKIAGDGVLRDVVKTKVTEMARPECAELVGTVSRDRMVELLEWADVVVVPSREDGYPLTVLEAQAMGRIVVGTGVGGISEQIVDGSTGLLIPAESPDAIAAAIRRVRENPGASRQMGERARESTESARSWDTVAEKTLDVYESVI